MKTSNLMIYLLAALLTTLLAGLAQSFAMPGFFFSLLFCSVGFYTLAYNDYHYGRLLASSLILAFLLSLPFITVTNSIFFNYWFFLLPPVFYITHCFHAAWHNKSLHDVDYTDLFHAGWNTIILLPIAALFTLLINGLITLFITMLEMGGINASAITNNLYYQFFTRVGLAIIGIGLIKQHLGLVYKMRFLALRLAFFIYPLIIILSIAALMIYAFTGNTQNNWTNLIPYLAAFFIFGILFFNAVFQEGKQLPVYPGIWGYLVKIYPIFLGIMAIILFYHSKDYLFTVRHVWLWATLVLFYGTGYAISVFLKEEKAVMLIKGTNVVLAIYFVIAALVANNPVYTARIKSSHGIASPATNNTALNNSVTIQPILDNLIITAEQKARLMAVSKIHSAILAKNGLTWKSFYPGRDELPKSAHICQVPYKNGFETGSIIEGQCVITYGGNIVSFEQFLFLDDANASISWQSFPAKAALPLGIEFVPEKLSSIDPDKYLRVLYACKVILDERDYVGKVVDQYCNIAYRGEEKSMDHFQVLSAGMVAGEKEFH